MPINKPTNQEKNCFVIFCVLVLVWKMGHKRETGEFYIQKRQHRTWVSAHTSHSDSRASLQRNLFGLILRVALLRLQLRRDELDLSFFILVTALY